MNIRTVSLLPTDRVRSSGMAARYRIRDPIDILIEREEVDAVLRAIEEIEDARLKSFAAAPLSLASSAR